MSVLPLRMLGDPVLRTRSHRVEILEDRIEELVEDMFDTMDDAGGIGLAAPQIGVGLRIFTYDVTGIRGAVVNPELKLSGDPRPTPRDTSAVPARGENLLREGCLSVAAIHAPVARTQHAVLTGVSATGAAVTVEADGLLAACFQHEVDHLEGLVFLDRLTGDDRRGAMRSLRAAEYDQQSRGATAQRGGASFQAARSSFFSTPASQGVR